MTVLVGLLGAMLGSLVGGAVTYLATRSNMKLTLAHAYDQALQTKRIERYETLFHVTRCLPRYWPPDSQPPTREDLHRFREAFHDWYFGERAGGMFLTSDAKDRYMLLLNALAETAFANYSLAGTTSAAPLSDDESQTLRVLASNLRHQLAQDVGAANPPQMRWPRPGELPAPPQLG
ncbi:hypothetical protein [Nocardia sp. NPDC048505]|uniref:hypothetical protein n=1 Tax=unclassified Nocardia TaxID=2637762 RepID=UPI0034022550